MNEMKTRTTCSEVAWQQIYKAGELFVSAFDMDEGSLFTKRFSIMFDS